MTRQVVAQFVNDSRRRTVTFRTPTAEAELLPLASAPMRSIGVANFDEFPPRNQTPVWGVAVAVLLGCSLWAAGAPASAPFREIFSCA